MASPVKYLIDLSKNPISLLGIGITTISAILMMVLLVMEFLDYLSNPYVGILTYLILPFLFLTKGGGKETLNVAVSVSNIGAGHLIPTGIPGIREMWLEVSVLNGQQVVATEKRPFAQELFDSEGKPAMPWEAVRIGKDTRIRPKKTRVERLSFKLASAADVRVEAKLLERLVSEQAARYAGMSPSPPMSMAEASASAP